VSGILLDTSTSLIPSTVRQAIYRDRYEDTERHMIPKVVRPGSRVVEIGAGIGFISLLTTKLAGTGNVTSFEANPALEPIIRRNFELNGVIPDLHMKAVTLDGAPVGFFKDDNIVSSSLIDRGQVASRRIEVPSISMAEVLSRYAPDVIVMDVEGAEVDLLSIEDFKSVRHLIVEVHPHIVGADRIGHLLAGLAARGFDVHARIGKTVHLAR